MEKGRLLSCKERGVLHRVKPGWWQLKVLSLCSLWKSHLSGARPEASSHCDTKPKNVEHRQNCLNWVFVLAFCVALCKVANQGGVLEVGEGAVVVLPVANMAQCLGDQVLVADHHPLGRACGARGEGEDGRVAGWLDLWR